MAGGERRRRDAGPSGRLIVARHGRTAWNAGGRYQGHADLPLDDEGRRQAAALGAALAPTGPDLLVVSDLQRAVATLAPLAARTGLVPVLDPRLREVDVGRWEGLTRAEAAVRFPDELVRWERGDDIPRGGGETRGAAGRRAAAAVVDHLRSVPPGAVVVVVSHGLVLRAALAELAAAGVVDGPADPPHLRNAEWLDLVVRPSLGARSSPPARPAPTGGPTGRAGDPRDQPDAAPL